MSRMSNCEPTGNVKRAIWYVPGESSTRSPHDMENVPGMAEPALPRLSGSPSGKPPSTAGAPVAPLSAGAVTYVVNSSAGATVNSAGFGFVLPPNGCLKNVLPGDNTTRMPADAQLPSVV